MGKNWAGVGRLCGFNLLNLFSIGYPVNETFDPAEFAQVAEWGFNYVRLPIDYHFLETAEGWSFAKLDPAVEYGAKYGLHVNINIHHAPGFCINTPEETWTLWTDPATQERFIGLWQAIARHYKNAAHVSYNLVNEATGSDLVTYRALMRRTAEAIYAVQPDARIIIDGHDVGRTVVPDVADLDLAQSVHSYDPHWLTHYQASWVYKEGDPHLTPVYPGAEPARKDGQPTNPERWDRDRLAQMLAPWHELAKAGTTVHCGEFGVYSPVPRESAMRWFTDVLGLLKEMNIGWAIWNLEGQFGVINSQREGGEHKPLPNGKLVDVEMLKILQGAL